MKNSIKSRIKKFLITGNSVSGHKTIAPSPWGDIHTDIYPASWAKIVMIAETEKEALDAYLEEVLEIFMLEKSLVAKQYFGRYHIIFTHPFKNQAPLIVDFNVTEYYEKED
jgi:hypothetical protein